MNPQLSTFWSLPADQVLAQVKSTTAGLSSQDAKQHLSEYGANSLKQKQQSNSLTLLLNQFKSPIILILIFAAVLSIFLKDAADAIIILAIVLISRFLGFWQERGATDAVEKLLALVQVKATVLRDGKSQEIPNETNMTFLGYLALFDPPKPGIADTLKELVALGITPKMITGDSRAVAISIIQQVGLPEPKVLTGSQLQKLSDEALLHRVGETNVFAEVEPNQKERIIIALKKAGNVVGYLGDGINDASALHAADVGIAVESAVDVAKEAADIVLMEKDLNVLVEGVKEGRVTFANTLKYVFMATSANFGNMFSMAGISLFLPFLPLLPSQILLTNLLTDFPEMTIATDRVDKELVNKPRRMDIKFIRKFMLVFGLLSSVFDYLTFAALIFLLHANPAQFRTGWFMESVISASMIVLVIRTRQSILASQPGKYLLMSTIAIVMITLFLPYTPVASLLGFQSLPLEFLLVLAAIVGLYILCAETVKRVFYQHIHS